MAQGLMESLSKSFGGNTMFILLILLLLFAGGDGCWGGFQGIFDNNLIFLFLIIFILGDIF